MTETARFEARKLRGICCREIFAVGREREVFDHTGELAQPAHELSCRRLENINEDLLGLITINIPPAGGAESRHTPMDAMCHGAKPLTRQGAAASGAASCGVGQELAKKSNAGKGST
jgi:hypothetical protein